MRHAAAEGPVNLPRLRTALLTSRGGVSIICCAPHAPELLTLTRPLRLAGMHTSLMLARVVGRPNLAEICMLPEMARHMRLAGLPRLAGWFAPPTATAVRHRRRVGTLTLPELACMEELLKLAGLLTLPRLSRVVKLQDLVRMGALLMLARPVVLARLRRLAVMACLRLRRPCGCCKLQPCMLLELFGMKRLPKQAGALTLPGLTRMVRLLDLVGLRVLPKLVGDVAVVRLLMLAGMSTVLGLLMRGRLLKLARVLTLPELAAMEVRLGMLSELARPASPVRPSRLARRFALPKQTTMARLLKPAGMPSLPELPTMEGLLLLTGMRTLPELAAPVGLAMPRGRGRRLQARTGPGRARARCRCLLQLLATCAGAMEWGRVMRIAAAHRGGDGAEAARRLRWVVGLLKLAGKLTLPMLEGMVRLPNLAVMGALPKPARRVMPARLRRLAREMRLLKLAGIHMVPRRTGLPKLNRLTELYASMELIVLLMLHRMPRLTERRLRPPHRCCGRSAAPQVSSRSRT